MSVQWKHLKDNINLENRFLQNFKGDNDYERRKKGFDVSREYGLS